MQINLWAGDEESSQIEILFFQVIFQLLTVKSESSPWMAGLTMNWECRILLLGYSHVSDSQ
uniref:Uncharacterized protein n=1 Tax=Romanomermis culicivorax TaxID=13658 RepID=A0A915JF95_ROMCU